MRLNYLAKKDYGAIAPNAIPLFISAGQAFVPAPR